MRLSLTMLLALFCIAPMALAATSATATTPEFRLSIKHDGVRASTGDETLRYSSLWDGGSNKTAQVTIAQNGATLDNLTGEGDQAWSVTQNGTYNLTHTTYTNGAVAAVLNATFVVTGKDVPFQPDDVTIAGYNGKYDGEGHGITVTAPEGSTIRYAWSAEGSYGENPSFTNVCGATTIWCEVTKAGYIPYTNSATVVISKREVTLTSGTKNDFVYDGQPHQFSVLTKSENRFLSGEGIATSNWATVTTIAEGEVDNTFGYTAIEGTKLSNYSIKVVTGKIGVEKKDVGGGGDDDPDKPDPTKPDAVSRFDGVAMYDGAGHTIDTNALVSAFGKVMIGSFEITYGRGGPTSVSAADATERVPPVFTNACEEIVWYKVTNPNYVVYVPSATPLTVGLIGEDTIEVGGFPTITDVGAKPNAFNWVFGSGTLATNYCVSVVTGTLTVTARPIGDDPANWDIRLGEALQYNGQEQSAPIIQVAFRKPDGNLVDIPYTLKNDKATDAGNYKVKITGSGNYAGSVEMDWAIVERNLMFSSMTTNWVYAGIASPRRTMRR